MSAIPQLVWLVVVESPTGKIVPVNIAETEEGATAVAKEAMDQVSLGLSYHASDAQLAESRRLFESIEVRRAWLLIEPSQK